MTGEDGRPPSATGEHRGLSWARFDPVGPPRGGVLVIHGADSCKERQFDFARAAAAGGLVALGFDARGHGSTGGTMDGSALDDVTGMGLLLRDALPEGAPLVVRGSSMGGYFALVAAGPLDAAGVVAVCPAPSVLMRDALASPGRLDFPCDRPALDALLADHDERDVVRDLDVPVLLIHAAGDERVPVSGTEALAPIAPQATLLRVPGGHHQSAQHDEDLIAFSVRFLLRAVRPGRATGSDQAPGAGAMHAAS